jgi:hypothetical protein
MFVTRDTGAQEYFGIPLVRAQEIFRDAYQKVSGLARTVRGPSMSANPGKIQVLGVVDVGKKKAIALRFLQGRNPKWVQRPFLAKYDEKAIWIDDLEPFSGKKFFYEDELKQILKSSKEAVKKTLDQTKKEQPKKIPVLVSIKNTKMYTFEDEKPLDKWHIGKKNFS